MNAPTRPKTGAYGECAPPCSRSGPSREPTNPPPMNPASDSAPTTRPCAYPHTAISSVKATMIQSTAVKNGRLDRERPAPQVLGRAPQAAPAARAPGARRARARLPRPAPGGGPLAPQRSAQARDDPGPRRAHDRVRARDRTEPDGRRERDLRRDGAAGHRLRAGRALRARVPTRLAGGPRRSG